MTAKLKGKFLPKDYKLILFRKIKNIKQKSMTVREYTEEFYKVNIRSRHMEDTPKKVSRYVNDLIFYIQYELHLLSLISVKEAYQISMKVEEKLIINHNHRTKLRGFGGR